jgi:hypothetical protein
METFQNLLIILLLAAVAFWYFGGFKLLRFFRLKKLKQNLKNPLDAEPFKEMHQNLAQGKSLPAKIGFNEYAILKRLSHKDKWAEDAYKKDPANPIAAYFYAGYLIDDMQQLRGTGQVDKLSSNQIEQLRQKLGDAEKIANQFADSKLNPADATAMLVDIYIHLGKSADIDKVVHINRPHLEGRIDVVSRYLRALYPRWGGSHELLQQQAEKFAAKGGPLLAAKAIAYCHLMEDQDQKEFDALQKKQPLDSWIKAYEQLPQVPASINSVYDYNLLLAHKFFAKFFLYINDNKHLKLAITNTNGHFSIDEMINPNSKSPVSFVEMLAELGISKFN